MSDGVTQRDLLLRLLDHTEDMRTDIAEIKGAVTHNAGIQIDHENRLRSLERFKHAVPSVAVIGCLIGVASFVANVLL